MHCGEHERVLCTVVNMAYFMHCGEYERILCTLMNMSVFSALW